MNKSAYKIALGTALITTLVILFIELVTSQLTEREFRTFLVRQIEAGYVSVVPVTQETDRSVHEQVFLKNIRLILLMGSLIGVGLSIIAGAILSTILTRPLKKLNSGLRHLRENKYNVKLNKTGDEDFDAVIDEFNKLTTQLEHEEKLRSDLISDVAHELKTPITSLTGQVEGIRDGVFKPTTQRIDLIKQQIDRLTDLVNRLQEYTRLRSKLNKLDLVDVEVKKTVDNIALSFENELGAKKINFVNKVDGSMKIRADKNLLITVLSNLIENAIKYSQASEITVLASAGEISVEDDGKGISAEHQKYIFERFYRIEKSRNRETGGLGLGLAIVKEIVEAHGGSISIVSPIKEGVKGCRFVISLKGMQSAKGKAAN